MTIALVCSTGVYAQTEEFIPAEFVPDELAEAADIANLANETGLPVERVEQAITFQHAFAEYADELLTRFPDQISAVWMEPVPNTRGHVRFTQDVPPEVTLEIEDTELRGGLLNLTNVVLTGGGMISMQIMYAVPRWQPRRWSMRDTRTLLIVDEERARACIEYRRIPK